MAQNHRRGSRSLGLRGWALTGALFAVLLPAAGESAIRVSLADTETISVKKCGKDTSPVSVDLLMQDEGTWSATDSEGDDYAGTYVLVGGKAKRK